MLRARLLQLLPLLLLVLRVLQVRLELNGAVINTSVNTSVFSSRDHHCSLLRLRARMISLVNASPMRKPKL